MSRPASVGLLPVALTGLVLRLAGLALTLSPASAAEPAGVMLTTAPGPAGAVQVTAVVTDAAGAPVAEVSVVFRARTTFGWLTLGERTTDQTGRARIELPGAVRTAEVRADAGEEGQVRAVVRLHQPAPAAPSVRPGRDVLAQLSPQPGFISPYPVPAQVAALAVLLGGIWTTYGYVVWLLRKIARGR
ncbi:MAG: Ig-like domain-containing protein [Firmicutes bacterium]|nr:Ig-like domain-containing protein [Bacillota bacterium]